MQTEYLDYFTRKQDHALEMVFTRKKAILGANIESPARAQPGKNIREVRTPRQTVFKQEQNELFIQRVLKYSQEENGDKLYYLVLGLNESSAEDYMKKIGIHKFLI